ncbi:MAG: hypothetical protein ACRYF5_10125, partial [Janthinobacterium lividum]
KTPAAVATPATDSQTALAAEEDLDDHDTALDIGLPFVSRNRAEDKLDRDLRSWRESDRPEIIEAGKRMLVQHRSGAKVLDLSDLPNIKPLPDLRGSSTLAEVKLSWNHLYTWVREEYEAPQLPLYAKITVDGWTLQEIDGFQLPRPSQEYRISRSTAKRLEELYPETNVERAIRMTKPKILKRIDTFIEKSGKQPGALAEKVDFFLTMAKMDIDEFVQSKRGGTLSKWQFLRLAAEALIDSAERGRLPAVCQRMLDEMPPQMMKFPILDVVLSRAEMQTWADARDPAIVDETIEDLRELKRKIQKEKDDAVSLLGQRLAHQRAMERAYPGMK